MFDLSRLFLIFYKNFCEFITKCLTAKVTATAAFVFFTVILNESHSHLYGATAIGASNHFRISFAFVNTIIHLLREMSISE